MLLLGKNLCYRLGEVGYYLFILHSTVTWGKIEGSSVSEANPFFLDVNMLFFYLNNFFFSCLWIRLTLEKQALLLNLKIHNIYSCLRAKQPAKWENTYLRSNCVQAGIVAIIPGIFQCRNCRVFLHWQIHCLHAWFIWCHWMYQVDSQGYAWYSLNETWHLPYWERPHLLLTDVTCLWLTNCLISAIPLEYLSVLWTGITVVW